jgi:hypothetical protein
MARLSTAIEVYESPPPSLTNGDEDPHVFAEVNVSPGLDLSRQQAG